MELYDYTFCASHDEAGRPCVRDWGTGAMFTPGDRAGHEWDAARHRRIMAPRYDCDAAMARTARAAWIARAMAACEYFGISQA